MITLLKPQDGANVAVTGKDTADFIAQIHNKSALQDVSEPFDWLKLTKNQNPDSTHPLGIEFYWQSESEQNTLVISKNRDLSCPFITLTVAGNSALLYNFETDATYYWSVNGCTCFSFTTAYAVPRWIEVGGLTNVRDNGGWHTQDGRRIKQGLLYRGSEFETHLNITDEGRHYLTDILKIKTDLDLRKEKIGIMTESPLGKAVQYLLMPMDPYYATISYAQTNPDIIRNIFDVLADSRNYPIYYHCWGGADRTGTVSMLLYSVLDVCDEDILAEYEITSLSFWGERRRDAEYFTLMLKGLQSYPGSTMGQKMVSFLRACGVTEQTMQALRDNLLE